MNWLIILVRTAQIRASLSAAQSLVCNVLAVVLAMLLMESVVCVKPDTSSTMGAVRPAHQTISI